MIRPGYLASVILREGYSGPGGWGLCNRPVTCSRENFKYLTVFKKALEEGMENLITKLWQKMTVINGFQKSQKYLLGTQDELVVRN